MTDMRNLMMIVESSGSKLEGWWIKPNGDLLECDHDRDWHHAQIALDAFPPDDESDDPDDDGGDAAITAAKMSGWIRGSYMPGKILAINWEGWGSHPAKPAFRTLVGWLRQSGASFPRIEVDTGRVNKTFEDYELAIRFIRANVNGPVREGIGSFFRKPSSPTEP